DMQRPGHVGRWNHQRKNVAGARVGCAEYAGFDPPLGPPRLEPLRLVHFLNLHGENSRIAKQAKGVIAPGSGPPAGTVRRVNSFRSGAGPRPAAASQAAL